MENVLKLREMLTEHLGEPVSAEVAHTGKNTLGKMIFRRHDGSEARVMMFGSEDRLKVFLHVEDISPYTDPNLVRKLIEFKAGKFQRLSPVSASYVYRLPVGASVLGREMGIKLATRPSIDTQFRIINNIVTRFRPGKIEYVNLSDKKKLPEERIDVADRLVKLLMTANEGLTPSEIAIRGAMVSVIQSKNKRIVKLAIPSRILRNVYDHMRNRGLDYEMGRKEGARGVIILHSPKTYIMKEVISDLANYAKTLTIGG